MAFVPPSSNTSDSIKVADLNGHTRQEFKQFTANQMQLKYASMTLTLDSHTSQCCFLMLH